MKTHTADTLPSWKRLGVLAVFAFWAGPALAGAIEVVTTSLPRDPNETSFQLVFAVTGLLEKEASTVTADDVKTNIKILLDGETHELPFEDPGDSTSKAYFTMDSSTEVIPIDTDNTKLIYHLRIWANSNVNTLKKLIGDDTLSIDLKFSAGSPLAEVAKLTAPVALKYGAYVVNEAPKFTGFSVVGSQQALTVFWDPAKSVATKKTGGGTDTVSTSSLNIYVFKQSEGDVVLNGKTFNDTSNNAVDTDAPDGCTVEVTTETSACACPTAKNLYLDSSLAAATPTVSAGATTIKRTSNGDSLENGEKYVIFMQYQPDGIQRSECATGIPEDNQSLTEANGEAKGTPTDFRCFIATAAYGTPFHKDVKLFRTFRDRVLLRSELGQGFVSLYYEYSPPMAHFIASHPWLRTATRWSLEVPAAILSWFYND